MSADNWYEERLAIEQVYRKEPEKRIIRPVETAINCLNSTGIPCPLERYNRVPKHDTAQIIPSDGFNEKISTRKQDILDPKVHAVKEKTILKMIHRYNLADLNLADRSALQPVDKTFRKTQLLEDKPNWQTSTMAAFGQAKNLSIEEEKAKLEYIHKQQSGVSALRPFEMQGVKCTSGLTGEKWKGGDPQVASDVQRAWLYSKDASLMNFVKGKTD